MTLHPAKDVAHHRSMCVTLTTPCSSPSFCAVPSCKAKDDPCLERKITPCDTPQDACGESFRGIPLWQPLRLAKYCRVGAAGG
eukprot:CAMPEP_0183350282 /NCGR_PEP_ID=MMETSP0164_2-20130417/18410_1 /TAXON_ID=221442 /ORGANISM="Coccolithus pelagicus ssp braarudi, Strain PLY182g" /LENGTH=82 /DNA_ID=CAMNT_0025522179 /DNA_START=56 /DNA_END=300 /DNA_ORIENTATION=+